MKYGKIIKNNLKIANLIDIIFKVMNAAAAC